MIGIRYQRSRAIALSLFAAVAAVSGCDAVLGLTDKGVRGDAIDASIPQTDSGPQIEPDAGSDAVVDAPNSSCSALGVPARPDAGDSPGDSDRTLTFAFQAVDFEDQIAKPNQTIGLNLDGVCTCPGPESCRPRVNDGGHCDLEGSIDNGGMGLFRLYSSLHDTPLDNIINTQITQGAFSVIVRIEHYNGKADDPKVSFSFFTSSGTPRNDAGDRTVPRFDGNDTWEIDPTSTLNFGDGGTDAGNPGAAAIPKYRVDNAYIADSTLVAELGDFPIPFGTGSGIGVGLRFNMKLSGVVVTARLVAQADAGGAASSAFAIKDGLLAGRWATQSILFALGSLPDQVYGGKVCDNPDSYNALRTIVCNAADIASDPAHDRGEPAWGCDAVSVGMKFEGPAAIAGGLGDAADPGTPCESLVNGQGNCP